MDGEDTYGSEYVSAAETFGSGVDLAERPGFDSTDSETDGDTDQDGGATEDDPYEDNDGQQQIDELVDPLRDALGDAPEPINWPNPDPEHDPIFGHGGVSGDPDLMELILDGE